MALRMAPEHIQFPACVQAQPEGLGLTLPRRTRGIAYLGGELTRADV